MDCPPNILYVMTDQQKASALSVLGNPHVPCSFQERMAAEGVTFADAYSASPICTPSRCSVMTGVEPLVHGCTCHQNRAPANLLQMPELLQEHGYYTAVCGHYEFARDLNRGWHQQSPFQQWGRLADSMKAWVTAGRTDVGWSSGVASYAREEANTVLLTERMFQMLDGVESVDAPWFLHACYGDPHPPYFVPEPYASMVDPHALPLPPQGSDGGRPAWQRQCIEENGTAQATEDDIRQVVAMYYGMIAMANDEMGRLYDELARRGLLENTWVIVGCDHGDYTGEKGMFNKTESLYECLLHVPLIIRPPDSVDAPRGEIVSGLVNTVDLFPTILNVAGAEVPDYAQGHDLVEWLASGARAPLRDAVFGQVGDYHGFLKTTFPGGIALTGRHPGLLQGARTSECSYTRDPDYGDEAYDLRTDPNELDNLLNPGRPAPPAAVDELRRLVDEHEAECRDLRDDIGVVPGYHGFVEGWE